MEGSYLISRRQAILVNSVLTSFPLYYMAFFFLPQSVVDYIDRLRRAFFWKGESSIIGGQCVVSWDVLYSPSGTGGLGICRLKDFNISLLSKLWWKLLTTNLHGQKWSTTITSTKEAFGFTGQAPMACIPYLPWGWGS